MASYRFYDPAPVFLDVLGLEPCAGGNLSFYDIGTTVPRGTWSDSDATIPNPNPVPLDSSGRANMNIWLSGAYSVVLRDSTGVVVWTRDVDSGVEDGLTIPPLSSGLFLSNDGSNLLWDSVRQLPDPSGSDGKVPVAAGDTYVLQSFPTIPSQPVVTDNSIKIGNILDQWGTGTIPASGTKVATTVITFPTPYISPPNAQVGVAQGSGVVAAGFIGCVGWTTSTTQLTVAWDLNVPDNGSQFNLVSPIPITWRAVGKVAS